MQCNGYGTWIVESWRTWHEHIDYSKYKAGEKHTGLQTKHQGESWESKEENAWQCLEQK